MPIPFEHHHHHQQQQQQKEEQDEVQVVLEPTQQGSTGCPRDICQQLIAFIVLKTFNLSLSVLQASTKLVTTNNIKRKQGRASGSFSLAY